MYISTFKHCAEYIFQRCFCHLQNESSAEQAQYLEIKGTNAALKNTQAKPEPHVAYMRLHTHTSSTALCTYSSTTLPSSTLKESIKPDPWLRAFLVSTPIHSGKSGPELAGSPVARFSSCCLEAAPPRFQNLPSDVTPTPAALRSSLCPVAQPARAEAIFRHSAFPHSGVIVHKCAGRLPGAGQAACSSRAHWQGRGLAGPCCASRATEAAQPPS